MPCRLKRGVSMVALVTAVSFVADVAFAQTSEVQTTDLDVIVVTGTSIRGVAPVGGNLVAVGREEIESTGAINVQQMLRSVPSITGMGNAGVGQLPGNSYYAPTIHSLGASASNSTLILIDGHRLPVGGVSLPLPDASMVPPLAIERVEVLAEGASATYGSDAVAGVVNIITRRRYEGFEATAQAGFGANYRSWTAGAITGSRWDRGSAMVAYGYSLSEPVPYDYENRPYLHPDHTERGGTNFLSFNCSPASVQPGGSGPIHLSPTDPNSVANNSANAPCDSNIYGDRIGRETRHNLMVKVEQRFGDRLTVIGDLAYSNRQTLTQVSRGGIQATVFRTGDQANPFYVNPPGVLPGTEQGDRQIIRWNANELLGPGAEQDSRGEDWFATLNAEYDLNGNFRLTAMALVGQNLTTQISTGTLCASCATLALNGTTHSNGSLTTPSIPGTDIIVTQYPLTPATALDVWNPPESNRTSPEVLAMLTDNRNSTIGKNIINQFRVGMDGELFQLPAGAVRVAVGAEYQTQVLDTTVDRPNNTGPSSTQSTSIFYPLSRDIQSAYGEVLVPIISPDAEIPLVYSVDLNISGRYDRYSDFGDTFNPKFAVNWEMFPGLRLRGNWSRSFVAPSLRSIGDPEKDGLYNNSTTSSSSTTALVPIAAFPDVALIPGIQCADGYCQIGGNIQGIAVHTGNPNLEPQRGETWSVGFDFAPEFATGLRLSATLFNNRLKGAIGSHQLSTAFSTEALYHTVTFYPNGATPAQLAAAIGNTPLVSALPPTVYYAFDRRALNLINLDVQGLDLMVSYRFDLGSAGALTVGASGTEFLRFDQDFGGEVFSVNNQTGYNTVFPSIKRQARANISWEYNDFAATLFANHVGSYRNWSNSTVIPITTERGVPTGGGDPVKANTTFDAHLSYTLGGERLAGSQIYLDVNNIFDRDPPFYNSAAGYDPYGANPMGRVVSVGLRARF